VDPDDHPANEGEIVLSLASRPLGLMAGYSNNEKATAEAMRNGFYHTSDIAMRRDDGYLVYVGRADDVFKASDYRLSPFELESVLIEHEAIGEAAVVPSGPVKLYVPKVYARFARATRLAPNWPGRYSAFREEACPVQADSQAAVQRATQDDLRKDPAR
jgi:acetyl-CoA synthetase